MADWRVDDARRRRSLGQDAGAMTRLINIDNGGTLTDFCLVDGGDVRYTKTLTTPTT